jgi:hypothetical protein
LVCFQRPDLATAEIEVTEWSLRAHDGLRIVCLMGRPTLQVAPEGAYIRELEPGGAPVIDLGAIKAGCLDFIIQLPAERRLEDRVLDVLRVCQAVAATCELNPDRIRFLPWMGGHQPDEFLIAGELVRTGLCSLP